MAYQQKPNTGSIFLEDQKKSDNHPDFKGSLNINGTEYWVSGWKKQGNGKKFISLALDPKQPKSFHNPPQREDQSNAW